MDTTLFIYACVFRGCSVVVGAVIIKLIDWALGG